MLDGESDINVGEQAFGEHRITARYRGTTSFGPSSQTVTWTAPGTVAVPTTTVLKMNANGTGSVVVTTEDDTTPSPAAAVDVWVGSTYIKAFAISGNKADINIGDQALGDHRITARYRGNSTSAPSSDTVTWTAPGTVAVPTTTVLTVGPDGNGSARVTTGSGVAPSPAAVVDVWVGTTYVKAFPLIGDSAEINLGERAKGDHRITARYRGNSTSAPSSQTITWTAPNTEAVPTTTKLKLNPDGTGTVTVTGADNAALTSKVDVWVDGAWQEPYALTNGVATLAITKPPAGDHQVTVRYRGNSLTLPSAAHSAWIVTDPSQVATTTKVSILPEGTGTIEVTTADGSEATNQVDLWVNGALKHTYSLTDSRTDFDLGTREGGYQMVVVRYKSSPAHAASTGVVMWSANTAPQAEPGDCGPAVAKADGENWTCAFADDFNGAELDRTKWSAQRGLVTGDQLKACAIDSPENVSVADGVLQLSLVKGDPSRCDSTDPNMVYTSGGVTTYHKWSQKYGRFEARIKTDESQETGLHEAFWMWPDDRYPEGRESWPANGEIDIAETYSNKPHLSIPFLHTALDTLGSILEGPTKNTTWNCTSERGTWTTYTLEWTPDRLEVFVNGSSCLVNTSGDDAFKKRYIMILTQALGSAQNPADENTPDKATMLVDYVRAWE